MGGQCSFQCLSRLFFADNSLVFARANEDDCVAVKLVLEMYEYGLG